MQKYQLELEHGKSFLILWKNILDIMKNLFDFCLLWHLIVFDKVIADMVSNRKPQPTLR